MNKILSIAYDTKYDFIGEGPVIKTFADEIEARSFYDYWIGQSYTLIVNHMTNAMIPSPSIVCIYRRFSEKEMFITTYSNLGWVGNKIRKAIRWNWEW